MTIYLKFVYLINGLRLSFIGPAHTPGELNFLASGKIRTYKKLRSVGGNEIHLILLNYSLNELNSCNLMFALGPLAVIVSNQVRPLFRLA